MHSQNATVPLPSSNADEQEPPHLAKPYSPQSTPLSARKDQSGGSFASNVALAPHSEHTAVDPMSYASMLGNGSSYPYGLPVQRGYESSHPALPIMAERDAWAGQARNYLQPGSLNIPAQESLNSQFMAQAPQRSLAPTSTGSFRNDTNALSAIYTEDWGFVGLNIPSPTNLRPRAAN